MPEGDSLFRIAATLTKALTGRTVCGFETSVDMVAAVNRRTAVAGRTVAAVEALGKHLLIVLRRTDETGPGDPIKVPEAFGIELYSLDLVLHSHMRMTGSWHVYRPGEKWQKPARYAKVVVTTDEFVAICFNAPVVDLLTAREATLHPQLSTRGPDAITDEFDAVEARVRLRRRGPMPIGVAIMDQRAMAGVGNIFKSETLFICRVSPFALVSDLDDDTLDGIIAESHKLLQLNKTIGIRRTRFALDERERHWVYERSGSPCRVCGETIKLRRQGLDGRSTYYCPSCQGDV